MQYGRHALHSREKALCVDEKRLGVLKHLIQAENKRLVVKKVMFMTRFHDNIS